MRDLVQSSFKPQLAVLLSLLNYRDNLLFDERLMKVNLPILVVSSWPLDLVVIAPCETPKLNALMAGYVHLPIPIILTLNPLGN